MKTLRIRARSFVVAALLLITMLIAAEQANFLKTDTIAALACTRELLSAEPDALSLITANRATIMAEAQAQDLPPEVLAAIIYGHQQGLAPFRRYTDCAGSALGADLSLGLAQIRISNAATNDRRDFARLTPALFKNYRQQLLDPASNIRYQAKELRQLLERDIRFPGLTAEDLVRDPFIMALLMSEYRLGRQAAASHEARLVGRALFDLRNMENADLYLFGRSAADSAQIREDVRVYRDYVLCERAVFNDLDCSGWHNWIAPLENQAAIRGCSWNASAPSIGPGFIFLAEWDESRVLMNIDGADVALQVADDAGVKPSRNAPLVKTYNAPGVGVQATYTVVSDCSQSNSEACELTRYRATYEVSKAGLSQTLQASGEVGC